MRLLRHFVVVMLSLPLIICCGSKPEAASKEEKKLKRKSVQSLISYESFHKLVSEAEVSCAEENCPDNLGVLFHYDYSSGQTRNCPAVQTSTDTLFANSQCMKLWKGLVRDCSQNLLFRKLGSTKVYRCDEMTNGPMPIEKEHRAYEAVRGTKLKMKNLSWGSNGHQVSHQGIKQGIYKLWNISSVGESDFQVDATNCRVNYKNYLHPFANGVNSPVLALSNCEDFKPTGLQDGFLANGEKILGVVGFEVSSRYPFLESLDSNLEYLGGVSSFAGAGFVSNFACSTLFYDSYLDLPTECTPNYLVKDIKKARSKMLKLVDSEVATTQVGRIKKVYENIDAWVTWKPYIRSLGVSGKIVTPVIKCLKDFDLWPKINEKKIAYDYEQKFFNHQSTVPSFKIVPVLNQNFKVTHREFKFIENRFDIKLKPKKFQEKGKVDIEYNLNTNIKKQELEDVEACVSE